MNACWYSLNPVPLRRSPHATSRPARPPAETTAKSPACGAVTAGTPDAQLAPRPACPGSSHRTRRLRRLAAAATSLPAPRASASVQPLMKVSPQLSHRNSRLFMAGYRPFLDDQPPAGEPGELGGLPLGGPDGENITGVRAVGAGGGVTHQPHHSRRLLMRQQRDARNVRGRRPHLARWHAAAIAARLPCVTAFPAASHPAPSRSDNPAPPGNRCPAAARRGDPPSQCT